MSSCSKSAKELDERGRPKEWLVKAQLDDIVQFYDVKGRLTYADVHVVSAQSSKQLPLWAFAAKPGQAADDGEKVKRHRYPPAANSHAGLVPFVINPPDLQTPARVVRIVEPNSDPPSRSFKYCKIRPALRSLGRRVPLLSCEAVTTKFFFMRSSS